MRDKLAMSLTNTLEKAQTIPLRHHFLLDVSEQQLVDMAISALQIASIQVIEWGAPLFWRMRVPIVIRDWSFLVPDDDLDAASKILSDMGLPLTPPPDLLAKTDGEFYTKPRIHRITYSTSLSNFQNILLYPLSFPSFFPSELTLAPRLTSLASPRAPTILHPLQPAVYASILRMLLTHRRSSPTRCVLLSDLSELIGYNLYDLQVGYVDTEDEELCKALEVDRRVDDALQIVKGWGWDGAWREEEEWMGDALAAVVKGWGDLDFLPWASQQPVNCASATGERNVSVESCN